MEKLKMGESFKMSFWFK